jgi:hypothetical protein
MKIYKCAQKCVQGYIFSRLKMSMAATTHAIIITCGICKNCFRNTLVMTSYYLLWILLVLNPSLAVEHCHHFLQLSTLGLVCFLNTKLGLYHIVMLRAIRKHSPQYRNISFHSSCLTFSKLYRNRPRSCIKNTEKISTKWSNGKHRILCWVDRQLGFTISEKKFNGDL